VLSTLPTENVTATLVSLTILYYGLYIVIITLYLNLEKQLTYENYY